jgi:hypothetical protein
MMRLHNISLLKLAALLLLLTGHATAQVLPAGNWAVSVTTETATYLLTLQVNSSDGENGYTLIDIDNTEAPVEQLSLVEGELSFDARLLAQPFHCRLSKPKPGLYEGTCSLRDEQDGDPIDIILEIPENTEAAAADTPAPDDSSDPPAEPDDTP